MIDIHGIFLLLGHPEGKLIKTFIELILFTLIAYMVTSEYAREHRRELKYLIAGFITFSFQKLLATIVLANIIFGDFSYVAYTFFFNILNNAIETVALVLLAGAFLFPFARHKHIPSKKYLNLLMKAVIGFYFVFQLIQGYEYILNSRGPVLIWSGLAFNLIKMLLILYSIYILSAYTDVKYKYRYSTIIAFVIYLVSPLLNFLVFVFYLGDAPKLFVASAPFPLIAVVLFTRVMYLKLADKAYFKKQLAHEKELSNMKDKFVSVVSHELRTPLTSISLYSSLLKDGKMGKINSKQKNAVSIIKDETLRLGNLVNDILDLSKVENKKIELKISSFNLSKFIKNNIYRNLAKKKKIKMISKIPSNFQINVDPEKFKQVLINLISNAIKYTDKGSIMISASKGEQIIISIKDTGRGIPSENLDKIFDKFYQVEHYMTRDQEGSGLGLAIAKEIVKFHKGKIEVKSEVGKGSEFSIILPNNL